MERNYQLNNELLIVVKQPYAKVSPNPPLWCPPTAVPASKQLKLSVLDGNRSFDLMNAKPARYHCTSQHPSQIRILFYVMEPRLSTRRSDGKGIQTEFPSFKSLIA
ncbi:hypothetical protein SK128_028176 [Halocaridina rubra]|uniref:Uncharacterized protein n=1 Tax=Halocaridina rubra TaxID=373956 RepID=A0AAN8ZXH9_HALRR